MKNSKQALNENSLILIISTAIVKIIGAVFKIPLATDNFLGDLGFGYFSVAHDLFMPFYVLAISGLPAAVSHLTAENLAKKHFKSIKDNFLLTKRLFIILGLIFSLVVAFLSIPLVLISNSQINNIYSILAVVPSIFFCFLISVYRGYFEGFNNMYPTAISKIIEAVIKLILGLIFAFVIIKKTGNSAYAAAGAMTAVSIGTLLSTLYLHFRFKRDNPINKLQTGDSELSSSLNFKAIIVLALPFALSSLASSIVSFIDVFTVKLQLANASKDYIDTVLSQNQGIYGDISTYLYGVRSKAFTLFNLVPTITMSLGVGALPLLTHLKASDDISHLKSNTSYTLKLISTIAMPAGIGLAVLSKPIMYLLYSSTDALSGNILAIYGAAAIFAGISVPLTTILQSLGLHNKALKHIIIAIIIKSISNTMLASFSSVNIYSAAIGTFLCYFYLCVTFVVCLKEEIPETDYINALLKPMICAIICGVFGYLITQIYASSFFTIIAIFICVLIYFFTLYLSKAYSKTEIQSLNFLKK